MRILVTFAVRAEFSPWASRHPFVPYEFENWERRREFDLYKANVGVNEVTVLLTGIGPVNAAKAIASIPLGIHDLCISSGLAGSLDPSLIPGDFVASRVAHAIDGGLAAASDPQLLEFVVAHGAKPVQVSLTSEKIIRSALEKESLAGQGSIVDMESAPILAAARDAQVPCVLLRAVSDAVDEDLPLDFARVLDAHGNLRFAGLIREVGLNLYRIPLLIRFGQQSRSAAKSLAGFLDRLLESTAHLRQLLRTAEMEEVSAT